MSRILPRYTDTAIETDPLEIMIAQREAEHTKAINAIAKGHTPQADPQDLRGIPCLAKGVGGVSPHTSPGSNSHLTKIGHRMRTT